MYIATITTGFIDKKHPLVRQQATEMANHLLALFDEDAIEALDRVRREEAQHAEQMKAAQKAAGRDRELAAFFKQEAAFALKTYRGACLVLGQLITDKGDCEHKRTCEWPIEIIPHAALAVACAEAMLRAQDEEGHLPPAAFRARDEGDDLPVAV